MEVVTYGTCRGCCEMKPKVRSGNYASGIPRFVDDKGKVWVGRWCGPCWNVHTKMHGNGKRNRQAKTKVESVPPATLVFGSQKKLGKVKYENAKRTD